MQSRYNVPPGYSRYRLKYYISIITPLFQVRLGRDRCKKWVRLGRDSCKEWVWLGWDKCKEWVWLGWDKCKEWVWLN